MLDILVYLLDNQYEEEIVHALKGKKYIYHRADALTDVIRICKEDFIDMLIIWPTDALSLEKLFTTLRKNNLDYLPVIAVVKKGQDLVPVLDKPIANLIQIPLSKIEFFLQLNQIADSVQETSVGIGGQQWQGNLEEFNLIDLIQMVETSHKDADLEISYQGQTAHVYFRRGKVIKAKLRDLESLATLFKLLGLKKGEFTVRFTRVDFPDSLDMNHNELLIELFQNLKAQDEYLRLIPDSCNEFAASSSPDKKEMNDLKLYLLGQCKSSKTLFDLIFASDADNLDLLKNMNELIRDGYLVPYKEQEKQEKKIVQKGGINRLFHSISQLFGKKEVPKPEPLPGDNQSEVEKLGDNTRGELIYQTMPISEEDGKNIRKFLETL